MSKPAARLLDMTAHGGMISGPGCPTVLIGKMPAARMTDMHVCPMLSGVVPHVGGMLIGPVPPTVFIGKLPAACAGDMALCVGPPSTVLPPGCPTVLLGCGASGGGARAAAAAATGQRGQTVNSASVQAVPGSESFPAKLREQLAEAARYQPPEHIDALVELIAGGLWRERGAAARQSDSAELTITDIVEILEELEQEQGYEAARHFASYLDYSTLTAMAMSATEGNDPNRMPTRFMLLWGADDDTLTDINRHPDNFEGVPEHALSVANLRQALILLGHDINEQGPYDSDLLAAHCAYLSSAWGPCAPAPEEPLLTREGDTLSGLAEVFGLASWKYLYELNAEAIGDNPDLLAPGTALRIPAWSHTCGEEKIERRGGSVFSLVGGLRYAYPWVPYSVTLTDRQGRLLEEQESKWEFVLSDDAGTELARGSIDRADGIKLLVPDSRQKRLQVNGVAYG